MPGMNVTFQGGTYELVIDNVGVVELADTDTVVELLAQSMASGIETVVANAEFIFAAGDRIPVEQIVSLFADTDVLLLEAATIFDATAVGSLLDAIAEAGAALLAAL